MFYHRLKDDSRPRNVAWRCHFYRSRPKWGRGLLVCTECRCALAARNILLQINRFAIGANRLKPQKNRVVEARKKMPENVGIFM